MEAVLPVWMAYLPILHHWAALEERRVLVAPAALVLGVQVRPVQPKTEVTAVVVARFIPAVQDGAQVAREKPIPVIGIKVVVAPATTAVAVEALLHRVVRAAAALATAED